MALELVTTSKSSAVGNYWKVLENYTIEGTNATFEVGLFVDQKASTDKKIPLEKHQVKFKDFVFSDFLTKTPIAMAYDKLKSAPVKSGTDATNIDLTTAKSV